MGRSRSIRLPTQYEPRGLALELENLGRIGKNCQEYLPSPTLQRLLLVFLGVNYRKFAGLLTKGCIGLRNVERESIRCPIALFNKRQLADHTSQPSYITWTSRCYAK